MMTTKPISRYTLSRIMDQDAETTARADRSERCNRKGGSFDRTQHWFVFGLGSAALFFLFPLDEAITLFAIRAAVYLLCAVIRAPR